MRRLVLFFFFLTLPLSLSAAFKELAPGLEYEARPEASAHAVRIDLRKFKVDVLPAAAFGQAALTAREFREKSLAAVVVNGGFFDAAFHGLGLIVSEGKLIQPVRPAPWGVFSVSGDGAVILPQKDWKPKGVTAAVQVGPRLVVDGTIQKFKEGSPARRSAVGILPDGRVEIVVSEKPQLLAEWAAFLKKDCPNALNLDGGGSTQISIRAGDFSYDVEGYTAVANVLAVMPRE